MGCYTRVRAWNEKKIKIFWAFFKNPRLLLHSIFPKRYVVFVSKCLLIVSKSKRTVGVRYRVQYLGLLYSGVFNRLRVTLGLTKNEPAHHQHNQFIIVYIKCYLKQTCTTYLTSSPRTEVVIRWNPINV